MCCCCIQDIYCATDDANIWEEDLESERNIRCDKTGQVVGATFNKLVERITSTRDHGELRVWSEWVWLQGVLISCCRSGVCQDLSVHLPGFCHSRQTTEEAD